MDAVWFSTIVHEYSEKFQSFKVATEVMNKKLNY